MPPDFDTSSIVVDKLQDIVHVLKPMKNSTAFPSVNCVNLASTLSGHAGGVRGIQCDATFVGDE